ncbi:glycoside hydrolase family 26 protein [Mycolicibacterium sp. A43C]
MSAPLVPPHGAHLGMFYGRDSVEATAARIGTTPKIRLTYFGWYDDWAAADSTREDFDADRIPLINWEPFDVDFDDIVSGRFDGMIAARATAAAQLPGRFFLDFAAEMNEEEGWGGHRPELYVAAWRHVHDIFIRHGATNAVWVWAPNNTDSDGAPPAMSYYPGDAYVDWTGIDGYNWGTSDPEFEWQSFTEVFGPLYDQLHALGKPVIIGETASDETGGDKAAWISDIVPQLRSRFPDVRAIVWFDIDKERAWPIDSSPASLAAFEALASDPFFAR